MQRTPEGYNTVSTRELRQIFQRRGLGPSIGLAKPRLIRALLVDDEVRAATKKIERLLLLGSIVVLCLLELLL